MEKPHAPSCDRNREPILEVLTSYLESGRLLEIGSGTGQHAVYFAGQFPQIEWVTSDVAENHAGIKLWLAEAGLENTRGPLEFQVGKDTIPQGSFDYFFSANTLHIMSWQHVKTLIANLGESSGHGAKVFFYGPFNYDGQFTSDSNRDFDQWLKGRDADSGIRDFEQVEALMSDAEFGIVKDHEMPANNRLLVFDK
jgi:cyclopropane fatty-acyl-phospholipid synthase-like methyltransferase